MFIGHFAVGYASKRWAPDVNIAVLLAAPLLADLLWPVFLLLGIEHVRIVPGWTAVNAMDLYDFPWSHSLLLLAVWGALLGALVARWQGRAAGLVVFAGVLSHWLLDWATHKYDMPLWPGGPELGLYLWRSRPLTWAVELPLYALGAWLWLSATRARNRRGAIGAWFFILLMLTFYLLDTGAPPPSARIIAISALIASAVLLAFAWWFDRHREAA